ncbi:MAG: NAD(P)-dependent alcohol dehydrogenase [Candidatus Dormibacteria bacterium]|jgi:NADPH:quinone reductase-like Zn-dependent oxidoreductase|nr:NAD(P)-dependent alcohol dehydrogenase [Chloroflexota bacterium]HBV94011.1 NAD(P)-dependent alcohol dehydrogenase [Chloroflexota bacterium]
MRAVVHDRYGPPDVLRLEEVAQPVPRDHEVLVRVHATTVNRTDTGLRSGTPFAARFVSGLRRPRRRILGTEFAGEVAGAGAAVTEFQIGDRVFGLNPWRFGAHAECVCVPESAPIAHKPDEITFDEAAAIYDGALLAQMNLRRAGLRSGQRVLIYGASGSIGTAAVQLTAAVGAHITAVCNTRNLGVVKGLGADEVIDYTEQDFTDNGHAYDIVFDAVGKHSFKRCRGSLRPGGVYIGTDGLRNVLMALAPVHVSGLSTVMVIPPRYSRKDAVLIKELIEAGRYRAVIDRSYPLEDVIEATRYVETEQKTGNVVLRVIE